MGQDRGIPDRVNRHVDGVADRDRNQALSKLLA
jgi:hypothetical protein